MRNISLLVLSVGVLLLSCSSIQQDHRTFMIPMRDGIKLSTQLHFPPNPQNKYPVILIRTPYKKENMLQKYHYFLSNDYMLVFQDVRGRFGSRGKFEPFINESKDGYDTVEWIAKQAWCDGNIGMMGQSYDGWAAYCAAVEQPPHLKTIIANCAPVDLFYDLPYKYGVFIPGSLLWCTIIEENATANDAVKHLQEISSRDWPTLLDHRPPSELDEKLFSRKLDYYQDWIEHNQKDDYWKRSCTLEKLRDIQIPVFIQSGWFDTQLRNSKLAYHELTSAGNKNVKMIIGPWAHTDQESQYLGERFMGEAADDIHLAREYVRWFDYWLKNMDEGQLQEPQVQLYAMQSNTWHFDNVYPLKNTSVKDLYFSSAGDADFESNDGKLEWRVHRISDGCDGYTYDPGNVPKYTSEAKGHLKELLAGREDYLFYKTASLKEDITLAGPISATLYASSSAVDTDWFVSLMLLDNDDNILEGIAFGNLRAKFRNSYENPELLKKNQVYEYTIDINHYGLTLKMGQKLGVVITSSMLYPSIGVNLNTGKNNQTETEYIIADQRIYHSKAFYSCLSLTILSSEI